MRVLYHQSVEDSLFELVEILYNEEYFGFYESALNYVIELRDEIEASIENLPKKKAPGYFNKYKENLSYITINKNKNTSWYIFFLSGDAACYIYHIGNNHTCAQYL
ncbi:hypothetical protein [Dysgonomonas termitidis]|uniref:Type II toxin-antitoxin system RelE/ParE family toxin n=1 Tax=Dysgonomonas termitidis TaxID=1516126 RepID=A0ABV9KRS5_9BACT